MVGAIVVRFPLVDGGLAGVEVSISPSVLPVVLASLVGQYLVWEGQGKAVE